MRKEVLSKTLEVLKELAKESSFSNLCNSQVENSNVEVKDIFEEGLSTIVSDLVTLLDRELIRSKPTNLTTYSEFTPNDLKTLKELGATKVLLSYVLWSDIVANPDFRELFRKGEDLVGYLGNLDGIELFTDDFREERVLFPRQLFWV